MADKLKMQADTALAMAHFAASAVAVLAARLHRNLPVDDGTITHLHGLLQASASTAPEGVQQYFAAVAKALDGTTYEGG